MAHADEGHRVADAVSEVLGSAANGLTPEGWQGLVVALTDAGYWHVSALNAIKAAPAKPKGEQRKKLTTADADGVLVRDCAIALERVGLPFGIWGDGGDLPDVSNAVKVANALLHVLTGKRREVSGRAIKAAREWRRENDKNIS